MTNVGSTLAVNDRGKARLMKPATVQRLIQFFLVYRGNMPGRSSSNTRPTLGPSFLGVLGFGQAFAEGELFLKDTGEGTAGVPAVQCVK